MNSVVRQSEKHPVRIGPTHLHQVFSDNLRWATQNVFGLVDISCLVFPSWSPCFAVMTLVKKEFPDFRWDLDADCRTLEISFSVEYNRYGLHQFRLHLRRKIMDFYSSQQTDTRRPMPCFSTDEGRMLPSLPEPSHDLRETAQLIVKTLGKPESWLLWLGRFAFSASSKFIVFACCFHFGIRRSVLSVAKTNILREISALRATMRRTPPRPGVSFRFVLFHTISITYLHTVLYVSLDCH